MISLIFFDFDGVIVESLDIKTNAFAQLFEPEGCDVVKKVVDYHLQHSGVSRFDKFKYIYSEILKRPLGEDEFDSLCDRFADLVMGNVVNAPYVAGALEFLQENASIYKCYVVSATPQKEIEEITSRRNIGHFFEAVFGAPNKKTDCVQSILHEKGNMPYEAAYVGDALSDYEAAVDNSVHFIARIYNDDKIFSDKYCLKVSDLENLKNLILSL